jgi:hypothetical protein
MPYITYPTTLVLQALADGARYGSHRRRAKQVKAGRAVLDRGWRDVHVPD